MDEKKREPPQQKASGVADVRRRGVRPLRNQPYCPIELASKTRRRGLVAVAAPPLCGLGLICGERVEFDHERRAHAAASRRPPSAPAIVVTAQLSSSPTQRFNSVAPLALA